MSAPLARLIAKTIPEQDVCPGGEGDYFIAYVARISNPANQHNDETAPRLLRYLREHQHWSPFEMANAVIEINTTRDIARQILRHRSFSFQEFSQRYASVVDFSPPREARYQDPTNRQSSIEGGLDPAAEDEWLALQSNHVALSKSLYTLALQRGIAKEVARAVLPEGLTMSRLYVNGTLRSWLHYVELRTGPETQKEHREVAEACRAVLADAFPSIFEPCVSPTSSSA